MSQIDIDLPDLENSKNKRTHKIARTKGFSSKDLQIFIEADTSIGKIKVNS